MAAPTRGNVQRRKPRNRQTKLHVVFSEDKRKEFLGGFKKRKDERRRKGREQLELKLKEERKQMKQERKEMLLNMFQQQLTAPEIENIVEPVTFELENHTVTITSINDTDFQGKNNLLLGQNKDADEEDDDNPAITSAPAVKTSLKNIQKKQSKKVTSTKAFKLKQQLRHKSAQCKVRKKRKILSKRDKHKGRRNQSTSM